jgi:hypothetical protein
MTPEPNRRDCEAAFVNNSGKATRSSPLPEEWRLATLCTGDPTPGKPRSRSW